uniref:Transmembrane protein 235b n=1 Tax=Astyanax mexicanus TaxID=7994 RepID=A0A8B9KES0_ASTMX
LARRCGATLSLDNSGKGNLSGQICPVSPILRCLDKISGSWNAVGERRYNNHLHSGLWGVSDDMHNVIAILLPLSLVLLVFGGICGLVSSLARSRALLMGAASYFLLCSLLTLSGVSLYITYSQQALEMTERRMGPEQMALVHTSFGWSMGMAWLSFILEVITGFLLTRRLWPPYRRHISPVQSTVII